MDFIKCDKCGKKMIIVNDDGTFSFKFGKKYNNESPVNMHIDGTIIMKCIKNGCNNFMTIKKGEY